MHGVMQQAISPGRFGLARLSSVELYLVHGCVLSARTRPLRCSAIALSWLGNGWVYLALGAGSVVAAGWKAFPALLIGSLNAGLLHCVYPSIKRWFARPRPYQRDAALVPLLNVLDQHSFPSGHTMTFTAVLVPLVLAFPYLTAAAFTTGLLMAWARLASAHHYPSDVLAGAVLGASVSYPTSVYALAALRLVA
jgi:undecaprenyl-diphosphatase